ncbi:hypothetical protein EI94DRAFT_1748905 [Lactarius quietus]|nr:hypothetical protein EI94DRAFT_1748905 [Lactarius quietus]
MRTPWNSNTVVIQHALHILSLALHVPGTVRHKLAARRPRRYLSSIAIIAALSSLSVNQHASAMAHTSALQ